MCRVGPANRPSGDSRAGFPFRSYKRPSRCLADRLRAAAYAGPVFVTSESDSPWTSIFFGLVWGLPTSFALPSVAACRRALAHIGPLG